jgi:hypothetical protein
VNLRVFAISSVADFACLVTYPKWIGLYSKAMDKSGVVHHYQDFDELS